MNKKVAIIGNGWVGKAMKELFSDAYIYTSHIGIKEEVNKCDIAFICVPTPNAVSPFVQTDTTNLSKSSIGEGILNTSIVKDCIKWCECPLIVIRSTVNPGDCDKWTKLYQKEIVMQPEYLGETPAHPLLDPNTRQWLTLGGNKRNTRKVIELYATVYNAHTNIRQLSLLEAEIVKLSENRAIFYKNIQCQELYDACQASGVDYYTIRDAVYGDDPRFDLWWTFIYPWKRGVISKCIPKDVYAWCAWVESTGYEPIVTRTMLERNKQWVKLN